ncbi:MAG: HEAT repeat domain-containing protein [Acidobacteriia bacterium]|nr:HEAT repeat domain-containing protein [Terriglobia bacterium]
MTRKWLLLAPFLLFRALAATSADCERILDQALQDKNPDTRKQAAVALSLAGSRGFLLPHLEEMVHDKDVEVRLAVVASLSQVQNKPAHQALRQALEDPVPEVSFAAAKALWALHDPAGEQALLAVLARESKTSSSFFTREKRDTLRMLHTPRTLFLFALLQGAGMAPVPGLGEGISSLQALLNDPDISGRAAAALLLGKDQSPAALDALRQALQDKDWSVRAAAAHSVALRNDPALRADLEPLLTDKKQGVRLRAAAGFLRLSSLPARRSSRTGGRAGPVKK